MYDIKIFFEDNWKFWAKLDLWKEKIYAVWNDYIDLLNSLKEGLEFYLSWKKNLSRKSSELSKFLKIDLKKYASQI